VLGLLNRNFEIADKIAYVSEEFFAYRVQVDGGSPPPGGQ
jgi:hypothetical protein